MSYWIYSPLLPAGVLFAPQTLVTKAVTDSCLLGLSDAPVLQIGLFSVDSCTFQTYSELTTFGDRTLFYGDSLTIGLTEQWRSVIGTEVAGTSVGFSHWEVGDPLAMVVSDIGSSGFDRVKIGLDDSAAPAILITSSNQDTLAIQATEVSAILIAFSVTDSCAVQVAEVTPTIVAVLTASDTCVIQVSEGSPSISATTSLADSAAVQSSDTSVLVNSTLSITDSERVVGSDLASILATGTLIDSILVQLTESPSIVGIVAAGDACVAIISDATPVLLQSAVISAVDSFAVQASDVAPLITSSLSLIDSCAIQASEVNVGPHAAVASEAIVVGAAEPLPASVLLTSTSDSASVPSDDQASLLGILTAVDSLAVLVSEVASQQVVSNVTSIATSDGCALPIIDEIQPALTLTSSDTCQLPTDERIAALAIPAEEVALMLLEQVILDITWLETIWNGGTRAESSSDLYAGSYRMGPRNADETRGTEY